MRASGKPGTLFVTMAALAAGAGLAPRTVCAESSAAVWLEGSPVAVLLFSNYTGTSRAVDAVMTPVYRELDGRGAEYRAHSELRPVLRRHRIRSLGGVTAEEARALGSETGAGRLLMGTIDVFTAEDIPEVGVSARVVAIDGMEMIAAESSAATSEDFAGLFGIGRVTAPEELAARVVTRLFDGLERSLAVGSEPRPPLASVAIVPFANTSDRRYAGDVVSSVLASELVHRGFRVVEPGLVRGLFLEHRTVLRGGIHHPMLGPLADVLNVDYVVTGEVETFGPARGAADFAAPSFAFGARLVDARNGRLVFTLDDARGGRDGELVLGMGRTFSLGRLVRDSTAKLVKEIERRTPSDAATASYGGATP